MLADGHIDTSAMRGAQDMYRARCMDPDLDPFKVVRECCDNDEHPETVPVILALDVTGSMGGACLKTAASLNVIMQNILDQYSDVEFLVMGIGDLAYDRAPIQMSQFESDIRIAEHLDKIWFERGGGGNKYESYTAAWYMGLNHTSLDCWKRGKKGIIITMGDEPLNPFLPARKLAKVTGDNLQGDIETPELYRQALEKFHIFHIAIDDREDCYRNYRNDIHRSFGKLLKKRFRVSTLDSLPRTILDCRFTTPWDMMVNQMLRVKNGVHNSCGFGIWETVLRCQRGWGISFDAFAKMSRDDRLTCLRRIRDLYFYERIREIENNRAEPAGKTPETASFGTGLHNPFENLAAGLPYFRDMADCFFSEELLFHFEEDFECMRRLCPMRPESFLKHFRTVIFENAQGLLLDGNLKKEEEFTTPSTTGIGKVFQTVERVFRGADAEVCYITRSYLTRHGDGPMENEIKGNQLRDQLPGVGADITNVENSFQGRLRYGMMDADLLIKRIQDDYARACGPAQNHYRSSLMVTHMNEYAGIDTELLADRFRTLYLSDGRTVRDVMTCSAGHRYCAVQPLPLSAHVTPTL